MDTITPQTDKIIKELYPDEGGFSCNTLCRVAVFDALENHELVKAQGLFTKDQVKKYIVAAINIGGKNPNMPDADAERIAEILFTIV